MWARDALLRARAEEHVPVRQVPIGEKLRLPKSLEKQQDPGDLTLDCCRQSCGRLKKSRHAYEHCHYQWCTEIELHQCGLHQDQFFPVSWCNNSSNAVLKSQLKLLHFAISVGDATFFHYLDIKLPVNNMFLFFYLEVAPKIPSYLPKTFTSWKRSTANQNQVFCHHSPPQGVR